MWTINADLSQIRESFCCNKGERSAFCESQAGCLESTDELSILIVDDEPQAVQLISESLREINNWRVLTSNGPREALRIMQDQKVDVLITDILMPEINGFDLIKKAQSQVSRLACITMSGLANREFYESSIAANASAVLGKPFDVSKLIDFLKNFEKQKQEKRNDTDLVRQLKSSEIKYRWIFKAAQEALLLVDHCTFQIIDANESCQKIYGLSPAQMQTRCFRSLLANQQPEPIAPGPDRQCFLQYHRRSDESVFPAEVYKGTFHWEGREVTCYSIRDVTQNRVCETLLRKNEAIFRNLILNLEIALGVCDARGKFLHTNKAWDHLIGVESSKSMGSLWINRIDKVDRRKVWQEWRKAKELMEPFATNCHVLSKRGKKTQVRLSCCPIFDNRKNFHGYALLCLPIPNEIN